MQYTGLHSSVEVLTWVQPNASTLLVSPHGWQSSESLSGTGAGTVQLISMQMGRRCRVLQVAVRIKEQSPLGSIVDRQTQVVNVSGRGPSKPICIKRKQDARILVKVTRH